MVLDNHRTRQATRRSASNTSKSFGAQSMVPRRLLVCMFENERTHRQALDFSFFVLLGRSWPRIGELRPLDIVEL